MCKGKVSASSLVCDLFYFFEFRGCRGRISDADFEFVGGQEVDPCDSPAGTEVRNSQNTKKHHEVDNQKRRVGSRPNKTQLRLTKGDSMVI